MKCADVRRDLFRYSERVESRWRTVMMRIHIMRCETCRKEMEVLLVSQQKLSAAFQEPIQAPDISQLVMPLLPDSSHSTRQRIFWKPAAALALAAALAVTGFVVLSTSQQSQPPRIVKKAPYTPPVPNNIEHKTPENVDLSRSMNAPSVSVSEKQMASLRRSKPHRHIRPQKVAEPEVNITPSEKIPPLEPVIVEDDQPVAIAVVTWPSSKERSYISYGYEEKDNDTGETTTCSVEKSGNSVNIYLESKPTDRKPIKGEMHYEENNTVLLAGMHSRSDHR